MSIIFHSISITFILMKRLIDYYFYRLYSFYKYKNDPALIGSSMITAAVILNLLTPLWIESIHALLKTKTEIDVAALLLYALGCAISFLRYKREKGRIHVRIAIENSLNYTT